MDEMKDFEEIENFTEETVGELTDGKGDED